MNYLYRTYYLASHGTININNSTITHYKHLLKRAMKMSKKGHFNPKYSQVLFL